MNKKTVILSIALICLVFIGVTLNYNAQTETNPASPPENHDTSMEDPVGTIEEKDSNDTNNKDTKTPVEELSEEFSKMIQNTIAFFSNKDKHIVAIGDSLTQGVGDSTNQGGYVGLIDKHLNAEEKVVTIDNFGKRGNRTEQLLERLNESNIQDSIKKADIILITIGANDIMQVVKENFMEITYTIFSEERVHYEERLKQIFAKIDTINPDATIYLIGFYNPFQKYFEHIKELDMIADDWNSTSQQVAEKAGATFIPTKDLFTDESVNLFAEDHFHPNEFGYQRIAERILNYLVVE
ncbi:SGNH/GDSL hydrolase family protein [Ornithinibacillus halotolerans]|uniref:SGNH hydrolase-type esterase domain-containing protein n=1 Tax=Ornithinibacillus halotolerans TaxID=1274357 RepID=A0A916RQQ8_9BACI|nr:SGNH/GDSL hydrolase family protein [Ornithinibacillus halotolerans]GGA63503.1 hypothetical protein GCM10008025_04230 [Ornithinibacillus halotolerans]